MPKKNTPVNGTLAGAGSALTTSYVVWPSSPDAGVIHASGYDQLSLIINYTKGDETNLNFKVQFSDTLAFTDAFERTVTDTDATGVSNVLDNVYKRTSTGKFEVPIAIRGHFLRVLFKTPDGTPTGVFAARYRLENIDR